jgi:allophanate hydrolase subunit 1
MFGTVFGIAQGSSRFGTAVSTVGGALLVVGELAFVVGPLLEEVPRRRGRTVARRQLQGALLRPSRRRGRDRDRSVCRFVPDRDMVDVRVCRRAHSCRLLEAAPSTPSLRLDAPWCPWNIEFIRRINGLESTDDVRRIVFDASYLVLGLGDVYLGAPVATPLDPRHRLVITKYNPARTWTPEKAVGIGGAYLCIYGMEGPGGYQFVGRTVQVWNRDRRGPYFTEPWLLRTFDRIQWFSVDSDELLDLRAAQARGVLALDVEETTFRMADYHPFIEIHSDEIDGFKQRQRAAFDKEREAWSGAGEFAPFSD